VGMHFFGGPRRAGFMDHPPGGHTDIFSQELHALCISKIRLKKKKIYSLVKFVCRKLSSGSSSATSRVYIFLFFIFRGLQFSLITIYNNTDLNNLTPAIMTLPGLAKIFAKIKIPARRVHNIKK
jgi:hypothetical protein